MTISEIYVIGSFIFTWVSVRSLGHFNEQSSSESSTYGLPSGPILKGQIEINCRIGGLEKIWIYSFHSKVRAQFVLVQIEEVRIDGLEIEDLDLQLSL